MKKKVVLFFAVLVMAITAKAQFYVGGDFTLWRNWDTDVTHFTIAPEVGYQFNEKWDAGITVKYSHLHQDVNVNAAVVAPYARFTYFDNNILDLFIEGGFGFSTARAKHADAVNGYEIGFKPGLAIKLGKNLKLLTKVGFLGFRDDYLGKDNSGFGLYANSEDLSVGFVYVFK